MKTLALEVEDKSGIRRVEFHARAMVNLGYVGRDAAAVRHHIEELAREGVPPPPTVPMRIPMPLNALSTDGEIDVSGERTSGEAEVVFLLTSEKVYVGVGSDHTDRELERQSMALSKQVCPNVLGPRVWDLDDIKSSWDELILQSWVPDSSGGQLLYQRGTLKSMLPAQALLDCGRAALKSDSDGLVIYSGTIALLNSAFVYGPSFRCELCHPESSRKLTCRYNVRTLTSVFQ